MKILLIILSVTILTGCEFKSSEDYQKEANKLEKEEKFKEAILLLDKAIEKDPKNIKALLDRAVDKSIIEDFQGAIDDYSKVIELDPDNALAYLNRGKNKKRLDDYTGAIADFDKAISSKGGEFIYIDKVENPLLETGFEFDVQMEEIKFERGIAYYNIDSLKRALDDFNFSIEKGFALADCYYWRGLIYLNYNIIDKACNDLSKADELGNLEARKLLDQYCK